MSKMMYGINKPGNYKVHNQGLTLKGCALCGKPLISPKGSKVEEIGEGGEVKRTWTNNDARALYHKECRKEGRRLARKAEKQKRKLELSNQVS